MDWTALVGGERISAGLKPFGSRVCVPFPSFFFPLFLPSFFPIRDPTSSSYSSLDSSQNLFHLPLSRFIYGHSSAALMIRSDLNDTRDKY